MPREIQTTHRSIMVSIADFVRTSGDEREFRWFELYVSEAPPTPQHKATDYLEVFRDALKDDNGHTMLESQKQAPVKFDAPPTTQVYDLSETINELINNARTSRQSPAAVVKILVGMASRNEYQFLSSLTDEDYQSFTTSLDMLIDVVGEDENHLFAPLMHFIGKLIEKFEEKSDAIDWRESLDNEEVENEWRSGLCLPAQGIEAAYSDDETEYTLDMLIEENPDYEEL